MNKLARIINNLNYKELLLIKKDLETGNIERLINKRIEELSPTKSKTCPVCGAEIKNDNYTLIFGPEDFRKKASFDGRDCLEYFLYKLKKQEEKTKKKEE